jgi:hypothetical protein
VTALLLDPFYVKEKSHLLKSVLNEKEKLRKEKKKLTWPIPNPAFEAA